MMKRGLLIAALIAIPATAQWVRVLTPGIPRTKDGKPNLSAPTPRTLEGKPDLSGIWVASTGKYLANIAADGIEVPIQPWAAAVYKEHQEQNGKGHPSERCISHGLPDYDALAVPFKLIQTQGEVAVLYEAFNHYRQIFTDGRGFPENREPTWLGYSVGKWDGDTLVVDTVGFNDKTWLDSTGKPHSDAMHLIERYRRPDLGHLSVALTIEDEKALTKPYTFTRTFTLAPAWELQEYVCQAILDGVE
jgi:hypothetical protein